MGTTSSMRTCSSSRSRSGSGSSTSAASQHRRNHHPRHRYNLHQLRSRRPATTLATPCSSSLSTCPVQFQFQGGSGGGRRLRDGEVVAEEEEEEVHTGYYQSDPRESEHLLLLYDSDDDLDLDGNGDVGYEFVDDAEVSSSSFSNDGGIIIVPISVESTSYREKEEEGTRRRLEPSPSPSPASSWAAASPLLSGAVRCLGCDCAPPAEATTSDRRRTRKTRRTRRNRRDRHDRDRGRDDDPTSTRHSHAATSSSSAGLYLISFLLLLAANLAIDLVERSWFSGGDGGGGGGDEDRDRGSSIETASTTKVARVGGNAASSAWAGNASASSEAQRSPTPPSKLLPPSVDALVRRTVRQGGQRYNSSGVDPPLPILSGARYYEQQPQQANNASSSSSLCSCRNPESPWRCCERYVSTPPDMMGGGRDAATTPAILGGSDTLDYLLRRRIVRRGRTRNYRDADQREATAATTKPVKFSPGVGDYREVFVFRDLYGALISGYLRHRSGEACLPDGEEDSRRSGGSSRWSSHLSYVPTGPQVEGRSLCRYLADADSETGGMRAYVDYAFRALYRIHLERWATSLRHPQARNRTAVVCYEDLANSNSSDNGQARRDAAVSRLVNFLFDGQRLPAGAPPLRSAPAAPVRQSRQGDATAAAADRVGDRQRNAVRNDGGGGPVTANGSISRRELYLKDLIRQIDERHYNGDIARLAATVWPCKNGG